MEITEVKVYPVRQKDDKLKAFVTIVLDDCFVVRDLKIIHGNSGLFVAMPSRKKSDGSYADIAHPLNMDMRNKLELRILQEYESINNQPEESNNDSSPEADIS